MPVYVRRCLQCHKSAEHFAHMNADHDALTCPHCGGFTETDVQGQCRSQAMQGDELKGTRERLWDIAIHPDEADEVRREFAGTGCDVRIGADGVGRVFAPTKTAKKAWFERERQLSQRASAGSNGEELTH